MLLDDIIKSLGKEDDPEKKEPENKEQNQGGSEKPKTKLAYSDGFWEAFQK